jgi:hypothetical protein
MVLGRDDRVQNRAQASTLIALWSSSGVGSGPVFAHETGVSGSFWTFAAVLGASRATRTRAADTRAAAG